MIGRLHGTLIEKQPPLLMIDVQGVGYEVQVPMTTVFQLPPLGETVTLLTHFAVSENAQTLYGFYTKKDRELFRTLIKVSGVGPKMALGILSGMDVDQLVRCFMDNNTGALVKVPGVGKKTAERLVVEMRDRLKDWQMGSSPLAELEAASVGGANVSASDIAAEAESALVALGYKPTEASKLVATARKDASATTSEDLIRLALRSLVPA
jgi:holliday junction DNA helicase RuvA